MHAYTWASTPQPCQRFRIYEDDWATSNPHGIIYGDGTIFLYTFNSVSSTRGRYRYHNQYRTAFKAAILRPG
jgi:hypothetical protein